MTDDQTRKSPLPEVFDLGIPQSGEKGSFTVNGTDLNTTAGTSVVVESNKAKAVPKEFLGKNGADIELLG